MERKSFIVNINKVLSDEIDALALNNNLTTNEMVELLLRYGTDNSKSVCRVLKAQRTAAELAASHSRSAAITKAAEAVKQTKPASGETVNEPAQAKAEPTTKRIASSPKTVLIPKTESKTEPKTEPKASDKTKTVAVKTTAPKSEVKTGSAPTRTNPKTVAAARAAAIKTASRSDPKTDPKTDDPKTVSVNKLFSGVATFKIPPMPKKK